MTETESQAGMLTIRWYDSKSVLQCNAQWFQFAPSVNITTMQIF